MRQKISCVYADDDPFVRELVVFNLQAEGIEVHATDNGLGVEDLVSEHRPDIVILDVMMPGRDGYQVLAALKGSPTFRDIPVILLSAKASDAEIWQGWQAGADYYLTKPFNVEELVHYLEEILAQSGKVRSASGVAGAR